MPAHVCVVPAVQCCCCTSSPKEDALELMEHAAPPPHAPESEIPSGPPPAYRSVLWPLGSVAGLNARSVARWSRIAEYQYAALTLCDAGRRDGLLYPRRRLASRRRAGDSPPRFLGLGWPRRPALVGCAAVQNRDFLCPMSSLPVTTGMRLLFLSICLSDVVQRQGPSRVSILNPRNPPSDPLRVTAAPCLPSDESDTAPRAPSMASGPFHATC